MGDRVAAPEKIDYLSICLPVRKLLFHSIGVREGILPGGGGAEKFALKITSCSKNQQFPLKLTFLV